MADIDEEATKAAPDNEQARRQETTRPGSEKPSEAPQRRQEAASEDEDHPPRSRERKRRTASPKGQAVTGKVDKVVLSAAVFESRTTRKSLTVHHIQRRLVELGYSEADADPDGWLSRYTRAALRRFQADQLIEPADGNVTAETFESLFEQDSNVKVNTVD